ncbi:MAG: hypothetical protein WDA27_08970 [Actinomycetota bacterium]
MPRGRKITAVARSEAHLYLGKAEQFLDEGHAAVAAARNDAAMLSAVHAAISASDAATVALSGLRSADSDHVRAADLLEEVAADSEAVRVRARQLRTLLAKKNVVEYESRRASAKEAAESVIRASKLVDWAREVVARAKV